MCPDSPYSVYIRRTYPVQAYGLILCFTVFFLRGLKGEKRMHQALYRKYRPARFFDVVGQDHITSVLSYQVTSGRTSHAYLFCGSRGTGKTTCAKILSKAVNCLSPINGDPCCQCENCIAIEKGSTADVLEMDAASNTGVDYIRDIKDAVMYAPAMLKNRVYIIDEVHMLSDGAFNALLKTLEEPPSNVIFILATTEMQKIPATILSRCQRFEFRRIAGSVIAERLQYIAKEEGLSLCADAAYLIARNAQGGMRDAISLLELCSADGEPVTPEKVEDLSGGSGRKTVEKTVGAIADHNGSEIFSIVADLYRISGDLSVFWQELISFYRDMIVVKTIKNMKKEELRKDILDLTEAEFATLTDLSERFGYEKLIYHASVLDEALSGTSGKNGVSGRIAAEMTLIKLTAEETDASPEALLERISVLEDKISDVNITLPTVAVKTETETKKNEEGTASSKERLLRKAESPSTVQTAVHTELKGFVEILHAYAKSDPSAAAFLKDSKAFLMEDGTISITVENDFAKSMLEKKNASVAISLIVQKKEGIEATVLFKAKSAGVSDSDALDDLE